MEWPQNWDKLERLVSKTALTRLLYGYNYSRDDALQLLRLIDWIITLPPDLEAAYTDQVDALEQELNMAYVTTFERVSEQRGHLKGQIEGETTVQLLYCAPRFKASSVAFQTGHVNALPMPTSPPCSNGH